MSRPLKAWYELAKWGLKTWPAVVTRELVESMILSRVVSMSGDSVASLRGERKLSQAPKDPKYRLSSRPTSGDVAVEDTVGEVP